MGSEMGKVIVQVDLVNAEDVGLVRRGLAGAGSERRVAIEGLVDTGATMLAIPEGASSALGVPVLRTTPVRLADGSTARRPVVGPLSVTIQGRQMTSDAIVMPSGSTCLVGQIILEGLDWHVDPKGQKLLPNPLSPDAPLMDAMGLAASIPPGRPNRSRRG